MKCRYDCEVIVRNVGFNNAWIVNYGTFDVQVQNGSILKGAGNAQLIVNAVDPNNNLTGQFLITGPYGGVVEIYVHNDGFLNTYGHQLWTYGGTSGDGEWY